MQQKTQKSKIYILSVIKYKKQIGPQHNMGYKIKLK